MEPKVSLPCSQELSISDFFLRRGVVGPSPSPQAEGSQIVGCPCLLIQHIWGHPPHLEAVTSIRNLRMRRAVVTYINKFQFDCLTTWALCPDHK